MGLIQCGGYGQVRRPTDAGREGGCRERRREDDGRRREASEHRAAPDREGAEQDDPACDREASGEATRGRASAQVSGAGLRGDFEDSAMLGERAEIAALPGVRNAASGTCPPRGAAVEEVDPG